MVPHADSVPSSRPDPTEPNGWGWRRTPVLVLVAAAWAGIPGLFTALGAAIAFIVALTSTNPAWDDVIGAAVVALVLCGLAAVLVFGSRVGYWVGVAFFGLTCLASAGWGAVARDAGLYVLAGLLAVPLALLAPPAARRPRLPPEEREARKRTATPFELPWPRGWTRGVARGWVKFSFMAAGGIGMSAGGVAVVVTSGFSAASAAFALFGFAILFVLPMLWPGPRIGRVGPTTVRAGGQVHRGTHFPYTLVAPSPPPRGRLCSGPPAWAWRCPRASSREGRRGTRRR